MVRRPAATLLGNFPPHDRCHLRCEQLNSRRYLVEGESANVQLGHKAVMAEQLMLVQDFLYNLLRTANGKRVNRRDEPSKSLRDTPYFPGPDAG